jgi:ribosomal-protein-alanine N-acetyltransferase
MKPADLPFVKETENLSFTNPWPESAFKGEVENPGISFPYVIVLKGEERIVGHIIYWQIKEEVQISNIAIHPDFRGLGIGKKVMSSIMAKIRKEGVSYIFLEVRPSNHHAVALYKKLGFQKLGLRKNYYHNPVEDAIIMGKSL